jgi:hypothetical protein
MSADNISFHSFYIYVYKSPYIVIVNEICCYHWLTNTSYKHCKYLAHLGEGLRSTKHIPAFRSSPPSPPPFPPPSFQAHRWESRGGGGGGAGRGGWSLK